MVCFNGQLHAARDVTKVHTSALETFQSYQYGALGGWMEAGHHISPTGNPSYALRPSGSIREWI